ncbi:Ion channel regulatory protein, UNC-93 [Dillenia turbinata]|uniref:Ion channel regulatory protein, UNC-93 n=1 Tax=Dillenia turbinata TaxID=194707 RepID=A0AAN8ZM65_9MAGN
MDEETPLVVNGSNQQTQALKNHWRDVHILSSAFLLVFLAYGAAQNLESTVNTEGDLGTISLGILLSLFYVFLICGFPSCENIGFEKMPWYTMIPAAVYVGFAASIIWVGLGTYLTSTSLGHAKDYGLHQGTVLGDFNGEFWGVCASHQFIGSLISLALLRDGEGGSTSGTTLLFTVFLCSMTLGNILMCFLSKDESRTEKRNTESSISWFSSLVSLLKSVVVLLLDIKMLLIIPHIEYSGLQQAFYVVKPALGVSGVGGSMAVYTAFDALCSLSAGRLTSGLSSITFIVSGGAFALGILGVLYPLVMAAILGIGDGIFNMQLSALLGLLFKHDTEGAFAQLKVWQSGAVAVVFFISPHISMSAMLVVMVAALCIAMSGFLFLTLRIKKALAASSS